MSAALEAAVRRGVAAGLLPASAETEDEPDRHARPWPVLLLTGFGAWLVALPLFGALWLTIGEPLTRGATPVVIGLLLMVPTVTMLHVRRLPLFLEQLALPVLLAGGLLLALGWWDSFGTRGSAAACGLVALAVQGWCRSRACARCSAPSRCNSAC